MPTKAEQVDAPAGKSGEHEKLAKKKAIRKERREGKKDPENAPKKRGYKGWTY